MPTIVPNRFPTIPPPPDCRLAVVGEAPGEDEETIAQPFVGHSGKLLIDTLGKTGIATNRIFIGNVCQLRPPGNDITKFDFDGPEIQGGLQRLRKDLSVFRPNCVLLLGRTAFRAARPDLCYHTKKGIHVPLTDWRGSIFPSPEWDGLKCVGTYHTARSITISQGAFGIRTN